MIVVDASAALFALVNSGPARRTIAGEQLNAPHLIDTEIVSGLRRQVAAQAMGAADARAIVDVWQALGISRYPSVATLGRIWELRENLSAYDASYVALAEALDCSLLTGDRRLARAPGIRCAVTTVPG